MFNYIAVKCISYLVLIASRLINYLCDNDWQTLLNRIIGETPLWIRKEITTKKSNKQFGSCSHSEILHWIRYLLNLADNGAPFGVISSKIPYFSKSFIVIQWFMSVSDLNRFSTETGWALNGVHRVNTQRYKYKLNQSDTLHGMHESIFTIKLLLFKLWIIVILF